MEEEVKKPIEIEPIEWEAESFEIHRRGLSWYLIMAAVLVLVLIFAIYTHRWLLSGVVIMVGVALYLSGRMSPEKVNCRIDGQGLTISDKMFTYGQIKSFWISQTAGVAKLNVISTQRFMPVTSLMLPQGLEEKVRKALSSRLPESPNQKEDWIDRINRILRI
ncbi:MAG: hypothetical protein WC400_00255 [Patescibacteria group bacterium]|jgi:hypothetical protein